MFKKIILVIISLAAAGTLGYFLSNLVHRQGDKPGITSGKRIELHH